VLNHQLGQKTDHAQGEREKQRKCAGFACFGFPGQVADNKHNKQDEPGKAPAHAKLGELGFIHAKNGGFHRLKLSTSLLLQAAGDQLCDMLLKVVTGFAFKSAFGKGMPAAKHKADHGVGGDAGIGDFIALCLSNA